MSGPTSSPRSVPRRTAVLSVLAAVLAAAVVITVVVITLTRADDDGSATSSSSTSALAQGGPAGSTTASPESTTGSTTSSGLTTESSTETSTESPTPATAATTEPTAPAPWEEAGEEAGVPTPSADELTGIVHLLTATDADDAEKSRYLEAEDAIVVPQTVSRIGLFRAPRGGSEVTGPVTREGDTATAQLHAWSQGIPDVSMQITFVRRDGTWRLSSSSVCSGVRTIGLPIYCNA